MDPFSYVSVIISVVIGLGLSHLLTGVVDLIKARRNVRFYWLHLLWVALAFVGHIFLWWTMWNLRQLRSWNFFSFLVLVLAPVLMFSGAAFLIPRVESGVVVDLRKYFYEIRPAFFGVNAAFTVLLSAENWLLSGRSSPMPVTLVFAFWFLVLCVSAIVKNERYHAIIGILIALSFLAFVILFGLRLGGT